VAYQNTIIGTALNTFRRANFLRTRFGKTIITNGCQRGYIHAGGAGQAVSLGITKPASGPTLSETTGTGTKHNISSMLSSGTEDYFEVTTAANHDLSATDFVRFMQVNGSGTVGLQLNEPSPQFHSLFSLPNLDEFDVLDTTFEIGYNVAPLQGIWAPRAQWSSAGLYYGGYRYVDDSENPVYSALSELTEKQLGNGKSVDWTIAESGESRVKFVEFWRSTAGQRTELYFIKKLGNNGTITSTADVGGFAVYTCNEAHNLAIGAIVDVAVTDDPQTVQEVTAVSGLTFTTDQGSVVGGLTDGTWTLRGYHEDNIPSAVVNFFASDWSLTDTASRDPSKRLRIYEGDGTPHARRQGVPPTFMSVAVEFQDRTHYLVPVEYTAGTLSGSLGSTSITGSSTAWTTDMAGWFLTFDGSSREYEVSSVGGATAITLTEALESVPSVATYAIYPNPKYKNTIFHSEADEPESVYIDEDGQTSSSIVQNNTQDNDDVTGAMPHGAYCYIFKQRHIYRMDFVRQPTIDVNYTLLASRGCFNQECWDLYADTGYVMDQYGPYTIGSQAGGLQEIGEEVIDLWRDATIDFSASQYFHTKVDPNLKLVRFWVKFTGDTGTRPKRCIVYHWPSKSWWKETYLVEVGASDQAEISGRMRVLIGSHNEKVVKSAEITTDLATAVSSTASGTHSTTTLADATQSWTTDEWVGNTLYVTAGTARGQVRTIASNTGTVLTWTDTGTAPANGDAYTIQAEIRGACLDTSAAGTVEAASSTFPASPILKDTSVAIIEGTGKGQIRRVLTHDTDTLNITPDWTTTPDATSKFLVGAIGYEFKGGLHETVKEQPDRHVEVVYRPTTNANSPNDIMNLRLFYDHKTSAETFEHAQEIGDGVKTEPGTTNALIDLKLSRSTLGDQPGYARLGYGKVRSDRAQGNRWVAFQIQGFQGDDAIRVPEITVEGVGGDR